jgi:hypothetical protein
MNLPTLDFTNDEALQASAEIRASVAMIAADSPLYFRGMALRLTVSIKSLFMTLMRLDGSDESAGDRTERDTVILLYLCTQDKKKWSDPIRQGNKLLQPLRARPTDWLVAIDEWADETLTPADLEEAAEVIDQLWAIHHAPRVIIDSEDGSSSQKKTLIPSGPLDSPPQSGL